MSGAAAASPWPARREAWGFVALLLLAGIFSVIDRAVLNIVVDPVRRDLAISDEQIALLQGLAFGLFYAFAGLPMGMLADRVKRRNLVAAGVGLWSLATIASGLAQSFAELFAARLLVGLGEAALGPAAISLIADLFPPERRGRPLSIYMMGQGLASGIAISLTGLILAHAAHGPLAELPLLSGLSPWRVAFVLFGAGGLVVVLALLACTEPARQDDDKQVGQFPGKAELHFAVGNRGFLMPLYLGFALCFTVVYGAAAWNPAMLLRGFHVSPAFLTAHLGPWSIAFSLAGPLLGGWLLDRSAQRGDRLAGLRMLAMAPLFALPSTLAVLAPAPEAAALLVASANAVFSVVGTVMFATLQASVPSRMRGSAIAMTLVLNTLIGAACGPLAIASVTQRVLGDPAQVGTAIALVCVPCLLAAAGLYALAWRRMRHTVEPS